MKIRLLDKVKYPDASGYAEWRQSSGTTQRDRKSKHTIPLVLMLAVWSHQNNAHIKSKLDRMIAPTWNIPQLIDECID